MKSPLKYLRRMNGRKNKPKYWYDDYWFEVALAKQLKNRKYKFKGGYVV